MISRNRGVKKKASEASMKYAGGRIWRKVMLPGWHSCERFFGFDWIRSEASRWKDCGYLGYEE